MASSSRNSDLMSLMHNDVHEFVSDQHLIQSPTHVYAHNLPDYVVIDVDPATNVNNLQDYPNAFPDSQSGYIPHFSHPRSNSKDNEGDLHQLSPNTIDLDENSDHDSRNCKKKNKMHADDVDEVNTGNNMAEAALLCDFISALRTPSSQQDDEPSFHGESSSTFMTWDSHNPWEDEISQDSNYSPFDDEFSQEEINTLNIYK
ncbi:hypothetical protein L1987_30079 [Smallanthus sonchifolius]|uniref:Uncharacterized protein n=1 Tax=Smallanthus sonchifolius TaxID=185202 RepID=A0ACB9I1Q8_9ASTR|nr:hypothetical protein L1987_30079 [Smallanthus sonchifolius]